MAAGIYCIQSADGRRYIGTAVDNDKRWKEHRRQLARGNHHSRFMQRVFDKHGAGHFSFGVMLLCDRENLLRYEQDCFDGFKPEYNTSPTAGSNLGVRFGPEARAHMSESSASRRHGSNFKGRKHSEESKRKNSESKRGVKRGPYSAAHRAAIAASQKGRVISPEHREKIAAALTGHKQSPEQIAKRVLKLRGRKMPAGFGELVRQRMLGTTHSDERREKAAKARAKLGDAQVVELRAAYAAGAKQRALAAAYEIDQASISQIVNRKTYRWVS